MEIVIHSALVTVSFLGVVSEDLIPCESSTRATILLAGLGDHVRLDIYVSAATATRTTKIKFFIFMMID